MFIINSTKRGHVHLAKCAGTYINLCCSHLPTYTQHAPHHRRQPGQPSDRRHPFRNIEWTAVVRDPVARFRSLWQWYCVSPNNRERHMVYLQSDYRVPVEIMLDWDSWMDHWRDHAIPNSNAGMWNPQSQKLRGRATLFRFESQIDECVQWLGGTPRALRANVSAPFLNSITVQQRSLIEQHYAEDMLLWESLPI